MDTTPEKPGSMRFRYNGKIFNWKTDMVELPMADLLLLNYRMIDSKVWKKMFAKKVQGVSCEICQTNCMQSKPSLDQHIAGKKHQHNIEPVAEFRHKLIKSLPTEKPKAGSVVKTPATAAPINQAASTDTKDTAVPPAPAISIKAAPPAPTLQKLVTLVPIRKLVSAAPTPEISIKTAPPAPTLQKSVPPMASSKTAAAATPQKSVAGATPQKSVATAAATLQKSIAAATPQKSVAAAVATTQKLVAAAPKPQQSTATTPTSQKSGPAATPPTRKAVLATPPAPQKSGTATTPTPQKSGPAAAAPSQKSAPAAVSASQKSGAAQTPTTQQSIAPPAPTLKKASPAAVPTMVQPAPVDIEIVDLLSDNEEEFKPDEQSPHVSEDMEPTTTSQPVTSVAKTADTTTTTTTNITSTTPSTPVVETSQVDSTNINIPLAQKQIETLKNVIHSLGLTDLKQIEYRYVNTEWQNMIAEIHGEFTCVLCKKPKIPDLYSLKMHLGDQKHKNLFNSLRGLYHPIIAPTKLPTRILVTKPAVNEMGGSENAEEPIDLKAIEREMSKEKIYWNKPIGLDEFKMKHIYLDIHELLKVEYREKSNIWYSLIYKQGTTYKCALCKTPYLGNVKNITEHLRGRKHLTAANLLTEMYHPKFCTAADRTMTGIENRSSESSEMRGQAQEKISSKIDNKTGKENLVINPLAVMKSTTGSESTVVNKTPTSSQPGRNSVSQTQAARKSFPQNPGLQNKTQTNMPTFATKSFSTKPVNDKDIEGFVGVEYVVKILQNATDPSPRFECCLCETETDGYGMQGHLKSSTHRLKYLDRHFPTCMRQFQSFRKDTSARNMLADIVRRIAIAIERYHGRDLPFECLQDEFQTHRVSIMAKVFSFRHASEYSGPSFVNVIDKQILDNMVKNKNNYANPDMEPKRKPTFDAGDQISAKRYRRDDQPPPNMTGLDVEEHKKLVDQFLKNTNRDGLLDRTRRRSRSRDRRYNAGRSRRSRSRSMGRKRSRSGDGWTSYKRMFDHSIRDLDTDYKRFERDPETHPLYQKEWKIFWQKRSEELANDGRDPTSYDFQPEWILFWTRRMDQLYDEEVDLLKRNLRDRLKLPYHNNDLRDERYHVGNRRKPVSAFSQILQTINSTIPNDMNNMSRNMNDMPYNMATNQMQPNMGPYGMQQQNMGQYVQQNMSDMMHQNMPALMNQNIPDVMQHMMPYQQNMQQNMPMQQLNMQQEMQQLNTQPSQMHDMRQNQIQQNMPSHRNEQNMASLMDQNKAQQDRQIEQQSLPQPQPQPQSKRRNIQQGLSLVDEERKRNQPMDLDDRDRDMDLRNRNARNIQPAAKQNKSSRQEEKAQDLSEEPIETGPLSVVSVLRLLTALEDNLGILGPRVIDLLAKALTLEKVKPNSADRALLTEENCVFLETVREKLRGQIVVGVLDTSKTRAVNQAIKDVSSLLNKGIQNEPLATERMSRDVFKNPTAPAAPIISQNDAGEKRELASKLATALAAQGKTNVSSEQLEQLIAVYSLIEKKQRENNVEQKKQSLSDLLVDFLKPGSASASSGSDNRNIANTSNDNYRNTSNRDDNCNIFRGQHQQQQRQQHTVQQFSNPNNPSQFRDKSNQGLSSIASNQLSQSPSFSNSPSSYNFGLSNFDTSLSLPSLPSFGRNLSQSWSSSNNNTNNNRDKGISNFDMLRNNSQNTPAFSTNLGRSSLQGSNQSGVGNASNSAEMVSYPSVWQRGGGQQQTRNPAANNNNTNVNQQAPLGWQQNNNRNNNNNARAQFRGRR